MVFEEMDDNYKQDFIVDDPYKKVVHYEILKDSYVEIKIIIMNIVIINKVVVIIN